MKKIGTVSGTLNISYENYELIKNYGFSSLTKFLQQAAEELLMRLEKTSPAIIKSKYGDRKRRFMVNGVKYIFEDQPTKILQVHSEYPRYIGLIKDGKYCYSTSKSCTDEYSDRLLVLSNKALLEELDKYFSNANFQ